jgi:3-hydroxyacyl-CoA dehydrogenase/enoyl-CoA hydratase/3-hydroxybutyryl-CoA epimerase
VEGSELAQLVAAGKLGKKSSEGFYKWVDGKPQKTTPQSSDTESNEAPEQESWDEDELERFGAELLAPMIEACEKCLADGIVASADHVDAGVIFGTGFAPFRGGPLHYKASLNTGDTTTTEAAVAE